MVGLSVIKSQPRLSIIVPVLNEAENLASFLQHLQPFREQDCELIVVDGGSCDTTRAIAEPLSDRLLTGVSGRAWQMNSGAEVAQGEYLLFLHADTYINLLPFLALLSSRQPLWGFFKVRLSGEGWVLRMVEGLMNWRSQLTHVATGDQGIFVRRTIFTWRPFPDYPLMEDVAYSKTLRQYGNPMVIDTPVITSSRRWEQNGAMKTIFLMWWLRLAYFLGVAPRVLHRWYYHDTADDTGYR